MIPLLPRISLRIPITSLARRPRTLGKIRPRCRFTTASLGWVSIFVPTTDYASFQSVVNADLTSVASFESTFANDQAYPVTQDGVTGLRNEFNAASPVPEPSMWPLAGGLCLIIIYVGRRRSQLSRGNAHGHGVPDLLYPVTQ